MATQRDSLTGRCALVTGSTSGIGLAIAGALAAAGAEVVLNGFGKADDIAALRARLAAAHGGTVHHDPADLTDPADIARMMASFGDTRPPLDILVNNAGIQHVAPLDQFPPDKWDAILALNLTAAFHTIRLALPAMRQRGWGRVVNVVSTHGLVASPEKVPYVAAKHGLAGLTKGAALEAAADGITVNGLCPGFVRTELVESQIDILAAAQGVPRDAVAAAMLGEKHPNGRFVEASEVAALAVFLCSEAAASITGALIPVDGGWTAR